MSHSAIWMFVTAAALAGPPRGGPPPGIEPPDLQPTVHADEAPAPGSLYEARAARTLIGMDGNARREGDLITVRIVESTSTSQQAGTTTRRESSIGARLASLFGIGESVIGANANLEGGIGVESSNSSSFEGSGSTSREASVQGMLTCKVVQLLPNGDLVIWGWKEVRTNRETQYLVVSGTVRPRDIQLDNTVLSSLLAEARIEITGAGVVDDKQGPGLGQRLMDRVWPF